MVALASGEAIEISNLHCFREQSGKIAAIVIHADCVAVRHRLRADEILSPQLDAIETEAFGCNVDQTLERTMGRRPHHIGMNRLTDDLAIRND